MTEAAHKSKAPASSAHGRPRQSGRAQTRSLGFGPGAFGALQGMAGNAAVSGALGGGRPLPPDVRDAMELRFGESFADVRIHDDSSAHASAASLHAKAYTHGHDIVFSANRFSPHAGPGKRLLAHELAHVVQQRRGGAAPVLDANASHEQGADAAANAVATGQGNVSVAGASGVGVARDEEEGWGAKLKRKYREAKEAIPPEYREKMQKAADYAADKAVDAVALPFGPVAAYAVDGLGSSLLHGAQKSVSGEEGAADDLKNFGRDKVQEGLGAAKGVATQVTEVVDTAMWVGNEYKDLRDKAAEKIGGKEGTVGNFIAKKAMDVTASAVGLKALPDLADASDEAKKHGLIDPDTKQASLTAPMSIKLNEWAKSAEEKLGATPREPEMFTPMEKAELASNIGTQVALSFTGAEEVKIAMNVIGAISGLRGIVESIRNENDWKTSPRFWGSIIGMGLSIVGLKHTMAASKITTMLLKFGWVVAAIPPLAHMAADYYKLETSPDMPEEERKKLEQSIKQDWIAAIHVIKDAILHVAQSQGGSSAKKPGTPGDEPSSPAAAKAAAPMEEGGGVKPAAKADAGANKPAAPAPAPAKPVEPITAGAAVPAAQPAAPVPKTGGTAPAPVAPAAPAGTAPGATPISSGKGLPTSEASKALTAKLAKQSPDKAGTVTRLPTRKASGAPPSEPAQQKVPVPEAVSEKIAVGQTHGADGGGAPGGKPRLSVVGGGGGEPAVASLKPPGGKVSTSVSGGGTTVTPGAPSTKGGTGATGGGGKSPPPSAAKSKGAPPLKSVPAAPVAKGKGAAPPPAAPAKGGGGTGTGTNPEPLVAVRVQGGGSARKGTYFAEGTPEFNKAATDKRFTVMPESWAKDAKFRPAGTPFDQTIQPLKINGVQVESNGAGTGKGSKHNISARADVQTGEKANAATFGKTVGASAAEAHGHKALLQGGEIGVIRPGNASTGGVDSITADAGSAGSKPKVFLNDFTGPKTSKGAKATHAKWVGELGDAVTDPRFGFNNKTFDNAVYDAIQSGEVYVRPIRVENTPQGTKITHLPPRKVTVPASVKAAVAKARQQRGP